jgi:hypothetical protein
MRKEMKHQIITILLTALLGLSCFTVKSEPYTQPTENDYHVGEKWVWKYKGKITNSRGYNADVEEVFLYAPEIKNLIKLTQSQSDYHYVEELIEYSKSPAKN